MKKILVIALALVLCLSIVACSKEGGEGKKDDVKGETQTWGQITVFVPEGYELSGGSITGSDSDDETQCSIQPTTFNMYDYWWIAIKDAEDAAASIESTKEFNNGEDVTVTAGDNTWTGCKYVYESSFNGSIDCGSISSEINGVTYLVTFCGHAPESAEMIAVLESLAAAE